MSKIKGEYTFRDMLLTGRLADAFPNVVFSMQKKIQTHERNSIPALIYRNISSIN